MNFKELRAKRDSYTNTMRNILNGAEKENRGLTAAESRDFDGLKVKAEDLSTTLSRASQLGEMRADIERPVTSGADGTTEGGMIYGRNLRSGDEVRTLARNEAVADQPYSGPGLGAYVRGIATGRWNGADELRDLAESSTPGSFLVPTPLANYAIDLVRNQARVIEAGAYTVPMESNTLKIARLTSDVTAGWKAENAALSFSDANFDAVTFNAQMLMAGSKLSIEVVEDAINVDAIVTNSITKALALELERRFPQRFIPRYSMVMFHHEISYQTAQQRGIIQAQLLAELTARAATLSDIDYGRAEREVESRLAPLQDRSSVTKL